jgi:hypothetical protein
MRFPEEKAVKSGGLVVVWEWSGVVWDGLGSLVVKHGAKNNRFQLTLMG